MRKKSEREEVKKTKSELAPGEEPSQDNVNFTQEAFKGKKVDGDPEKEEDKPSDQAL